MEPKKFNLLQWQKQGHAVNHADRGCFLNKISGIRSWTIEKKLRNGKWYGGEGIGERNGDEVRAEEVFFFLEFIVSSVEAPHPLAWTCIP